MDSDNLDNEFMKNIDKEVTSSIVRKNLRVPKIRKNSSRFKNPMLDNLYDRYAQLTPVLEDEFYPNRMRKARTPYWLEYASYGVQKAVDNQLLRELGNTWVVQRCKSIIIDEVLSNDYNFVPTATDDYSNETANIIDIANTFFHNMNRRGEDFKDIMRTYLNDTLDLGLGIAVKGFHKEAYFPINTDNMHPEETEKPNIEDLTYVPKNLGHGLVREVTSYDSASFYAQPDHHGSTIGWWQWLNQGTPIFFGEREIVPLVLYPVTYSPYGISPVEVVKNLVSVLVNSVSNMEQFMEDGAVPPAIGILSKINKTDYEDFIDRWEADVEGNNTEIPIMSVGEDGDFKFQPLTLNSADIKQLDTLDVYQKIVMSVFHVTPDELGFTDTSNRSVGEAQAKVQQRVAIFPFMNRIETIVNRYILPEIDPENKIKFEFERPKTDADKQAEWSLVERKLNAGVMTINEYLNSIGKPTTPWGNIPFNMGLWTSLAERFDISLFGFREEVNDQTDAKIEYAQRQIMMLIEQMQYMLNSDREISPDAVNVLTKLRFLSESLNPKGSLGKPTGSVIDLERMFDAANRSNVYDTTRTVFNRYGNNSLEQVEQRKEELKNDEEYLEEISKSMTQKKIPVESTLNIIGDRLSNDFFLQETDVDSPQTFLNLDRAINKFENDIQSLVVRKFRGWYNTLKTLLGFVTSTESLTFKLLESQVERIIDEDGLARDIEKILKDTFSTGFSFNNAFRTYNDFASTDFTLLNQDIAEWIEMNSFGSAKEISETLKKRLRTSLRDGYGKGESISKLRQRIQTEMGLTRKLLPKTKNYAEMVAKTEVSRVVNYAKKTQIEMMGEKQWRYVARLDDRNKNERPNENGYTCRGLHNKVFSVNKTDVMPPLHPNCRCAIVGITKKSLQGSVGKALTSADTEALTPTVIATDAEAAKPHPSEKGRKACVQKKIPILKKEHPEWKMDQVVAVAYHMCAEGHKKDLPITNEIIANELFDTLILGVTAKSFIADTYLDMPQEDAIARAKGNLSFAKDEITRNKWEMIVDVISAKSQVQIPNWLDKLSNRNPEYAIAQAERYRNNLKTDKAKQRMDTVISLLNSKRRGMRGSVKKEDIKELKNRKFKLTTRKVRGVPSFAKNESITYAELERRIKTEKDPKMKKRYVALKKARDTAIKDLENKLKKQRSKEDEEKERAEERPKQEQMLQRRATIRRADKEMRKLERLSKRKTTPIESVNINYDKIKRKKKLTKYEKLFLDNQRRAADNIKERLMGSKDDNEEDNTASVDPIYSERRKLQLRLNDLTGKKRTTSSDDEGSEGRAMAPSTAKEILKDYDNSVEIFLNTRVSFADFVNTILPVDQVSKVYMMHHFDTLSPSFNKDSNKFLFRKISSNKIFDNFLKAQEILEKEDFNKNKLSVKDRQLVNNYEKALKRLAELNLLSRKAKRARSEKNKIKLERELKASRYRDTAFIFENMIDPKLLSYYKIRRKNLDEEEEDDKEKVTRREKPKKPKPAPKEENNEEMSDDPSEEELEEDADMKE